MQDVEVWETIVLIVVIIGAINWLVVFLFQVSGDRRVVPDLFYLIGLGNTFVPTLVYLVVGGAGIASAVALGLSMKEKE